MQRDKPNWAGHIKKEDVFDIPQPMLFNLEADIAERRDVAGENPNVVARLLELAEHGRSDIGDYDRVGRNARFFDPQPRRPDIAKLRKR